tara:strand:+ start:546 stop:968 length:423 start_codon:yes stop_codon:yes gene_type:complete
MNSFFIAIIGVPAIEIFLMIKIGGKIGALATISLIFFTAVIGVYFAKLEGIKTIKSGVLNFYQNKMPIYEIISGASIALAALLLIIPGFLTDFLGFLILIPLTRKFLIKSFIKINKQEYKKNKEILDGEIIEEKNKKDEL